MGWRGDVCGDEATDSLLWVDATRLETTRCFGALLTVPCYFLLSVWVVRSTSEWWPSLLSLTSNLVRWWCLALAIVPLVCLVGHDSLPLAVWADLAATVLFWLLLSTRAREAQWEMCFFTLPLFSFPRFWAACLKLHDDWQPESLPPVIEVPFCFVLLGALYWVRAAVFPNALLDDMRGQQWFRASPIQRLLFGWASPDRLRPRRGTPLRIADLALLPKSVRPTAATERLQQSWRERCRCTSRAGARALAASILDAVGPRKVAVCSVLRLLRDTCGLAACELAANTADTVIAGPQHWGVLYAVGLFLLLAVQAPLRSHYDFRAAVGALRCRAALLGSLGAQTVALREFERVERAPQGGLAVLSGSDTNAVVAAHLAMYDAWAQPLCASAAAGLLWRRAGWGAAAGATTAAASAVLTTALAVAASGRRRQATAAEAEGAAEAARVIRAGRSLLSPGGRWLGRALDAAARPWKKWSAAAKQMGVIDALAAGLGLAAPAFAVSTLCFASPTNYLSPSSVFACLMELLILAHALTSFPVTIRRVLGSVGPLARIAGYLYPADALESLNDGGAASSGSDADGEQADPVPATTHRSAAPYTMSIGVPTAVSTSPRRLARGCGLELQDAFFALPGRRPAGVGDVDPTDPVVGLRDVSLKLSIGERLGVVGPPMAGKSLLVTALAGELRLLSGAANMNGLGVSVSTQVPFLQWGRTLQSNIVCGRVLRKRRYAKVAACCGLPADDASAATVLHRGLVTPCERARIALARALYPAGPRIVLLDDPFASMEPRLGRAVAAKVLSHDGPLRAAACVVTARNPFHLSGCDHFTKILGGRLRESSSSITSLLVEASSEVAKAAAVAALAAAVGGALGEGGWAVGEGARAAVVLPDIRLDDGSSDDSSAPADSDDYEAPSPTHRTMPRTGSLEAASTLRSKGKAGPECPPAPRGRPPPATPDPGNGTLQAGAPVPKIGLAGALSSIVKRATPTGSDVAPGSSLPPREFSLATEGRQQQVWQQSELANDGAPVPAAVAARCLMMMEEKRRRQHRSPRSPRSRIQSPRRQTALFLPPPVLATSTAAAVAAAPLQAPLVDDDTATTLTTELPDSEAEPLLPQEDGKRPKKRKKPKFKPPPLPPPPSVVRPALKASGAPGLYVATVLAAVAAQSCRAVGDFVLGGWSEHDGDGDKRLAYVAALGFMQLLLAAAAAGLASLAATHAAGRLHTRWLSAALTKQGSRHSALLTLRDGLTAMSGPFQAHFQRAALLWSGVAAAVVVCATTDPRTLIGLAPLGAAVWHVSRRLMEVHHDLRSVDAAAVLPVDGFVREAWAGAPVLRRCPHSHTMDELSRRLTPHLRAVYTSVAVGEWARLRLHLATACAALTVCVCAAVDPVSGGWAGIAAQVAVALRIYYAVAVDLTLPTFAEAECVHQAAIAAGSISTSKKPQQPAAADDDDDKSLGPVSYPALCVQDLPVSEGGVGEGGQSADGHLSLRADAGHAVAVCGTPGHAQEAWSRLADSLLLCDGVPPSASVLVRGTAVARLQRGRPHVVVVDGRPYLVPGDGADASGGDDPISPDVLRLAGLHSGRDGGALGGEERMRLQIARAVHEILAMGSACASVAVVLLADNVAGSGGAVLPTVRACFPEAAVVIAAASLQTVLLCDEVVVVSEEGVVDSGSTRVGEGLPHPSATMSDTPMPSLGATHRGGAVSLASSACSAAPGFAARMFERIYDRAIKTGSDDVAMLAAQVLRKAKPRPVGTPPASMPASMHVPRLELLAGSCGQRPMEVAAAAAHLQEVAVAS